jgi:hypothetical protein
LASALTLPTDSGATLTSSTTTLVNISVPIIVVSFGSGGSNKGLAGMLSGSMTMRATLTIDNTTMVVIASSGGECAALLTLHAETDAQALSV